MVNQLIYRSNNSKVFIEENEEFGRVIVKYLNEEYPSPLIIKQFFNEYELLKGIDIAGVRKAHHWTKTQNKYTICLEYIDGQTLKEYSKLNPPIKNILRVIWSAVKTLSELHRNNIIHKDISPGNILVYLDSLTTKLIDFGNSTKLNLKVQHLGNPDKLEGTLAYMSPEQTGRLNRVVDYRTDLYSLGVVLYEMLAGQLPFENDDPLEMVHAHIATAPKPVNELNKNVPLVVSKIISKLLEKNAEDRYQSAIGLLRDLDLCIDKFDENGNVEDFEIGQQDVNDKFQLIQKLYGRESEIDALLRSFDKVSKGSSQLMLVSGYSGTGKSALVSEIYKPITEKRGYFIDGKFDQFQRAVPYYAVLLAFKSYINLLLTEDERKLNYYKEEIQNAIGQEGQVLIELIPSLELVIGPQPPVPEVSGVEARNRFKYVFQQFLKVLASEEHPIVLFIDDLQWADSASLDLLSALLIDPSINYFLCICAYRDNEVDEAHPFIKMVDELRGAELDISEIHIKNLLTDDVHQLIADSLDLSKEETQGLTNLVYEKTQGNAFFVTQFLKSLYEESLLQYDLEDGKWTWDLEKIKSLNITENVVDFMAKQISKSDKKLQEVLITAASVGNVFDLKTLAIIQDSDEKVLKKELEYALSEGWVFIVDDHYKFAHDRIQQAVYSLIDDEKRKWLHLNIGRHLLNKYQDRELDERLFDIVNQINGGVDLIEEEKEKTELSRLNLKACKKAKTTSAFEEAYEYVKTGISLLKKDPWNNNYDLSLALYKEAAETAFLVTAFDEMNGYVDAVTKNAKDLISRVEVLEIRINAFKAENRLKEALSTGFDVLNQLGEKFPKKAGNHHIMPDLLRTMFLLRGKTVEEIKDLPENTNKEKRAAMRILSKIAPSAYWGDPLFFPLVILRMVRLSLKYGTTVVSAFGFSTYGIIQVGVLGRSEVGYKFGKIGLQLLDKYDAKEWIPEVYTAVYGLINIWKDHIKTTLKPLIESYHVGLETGAIEFGCINANLYCIHSLLIGKSLEKLEQETNAYSKTFAQYKQEINFMYNEVYRQAMRNLLAKNDKPIRLVGEAFDEEEKFAQNIQETNKTGTLYIYFLRIFLSNYFGEKQYAWENVLNGEPLLDAVLAKIEQGYFWFHSGVASAAYYDIAEEGEKSRVMKQLKSSMSKVKKLAKNGPPNYMHKQYLLEAELARIKGRSSEARKLYDLSIMGAAENEFINEEALANEKAGLFHQGEGNDILAGFYIRNAYQNYRYWGAKAKMADLALKFPNFVSDIQEGMSTRVTTKGTTTTSRRSGASLDLNSILKASTALSGEIVLTKLLTELMHILSENVGANKSMFLLFNNNRLYVEAILNDQQIDEERLLKSIPLDDFDELPMSVIKFIRRTKQNVIISNAVEDPTFSKDKYIQRLRPKSILAYPIINKGAFIGILYLENNITEAAFTEDSIQLINLLSGQIAVSIENARLYESLEQKVEERTQELAEEKKKSDDLLLNILPAQTAQELKNNGKAKSRKYDMVTVLFSDFKNFTQISESLSPEELVEDLGEFFEAFDKITQKYKIEKIKTIGDAYMCVSGLPLIRADHAESAVSAAIEMRNYMLNVEKKRKKEGKPFFEIRIGLNSGPVVAGVVGLHKFAFDIWGDTVNTASRMESNSEPSKINISGSTYELVKDKFDCSYRGKIPAKNKGEIDMYFIENNIN